ncbi:NFACT RNA binding domain-containing protein, partial [Candidatus Cloacimonadota bacterium]
QEDLSAQANLDRLYKKYRKARDGKKKIQEQIGITFEEIETLEKFQKKLRSFSIETLEKRIGNLNGEDIYFSDVKEVRHSDETRSAYRSLKINDNWEILVGRTSKENDLLTTKTANPYDWWFHTRIFKGTHVVLRNYGKKGELPEELLNLSCRIAAYFSKAKKSANVPVDYTQIRYVRKPRKSPPGFVVYTNQKTLYVDPLSLRDAAAEIRKWKKG